MTCGGSKDERRAGLIPAPPLARGQTRRLGAAGEISGNVVFAPGPFFISRADAMEPAQKRFIPIAEFCRLSAWDIKPARLKYWCRFGLHGEPVPHRKLGARYFIDAAAMGSWLNSMTRVRHANEEEAARIIARVIERESGNGEIEKGDF